MSRFVLIVLPLWISSRTVSSLKEIRVLVSDDEGKNGSSITRKSFLKSGGENARTRILENEHLADDNTAEYNLHKQSYTSGTGKFCQPAIHQDLSLKFKRGDFWVDQNTETCLESCHLMPNGDIEPKFDQFEEYCRHTADRPDTIDAVVGSHEGMIWSPTCREFFECLFGCDVYGGDRNILRDRADNPHARKQLLEETLPDPDAPERLCETTQCRSYCANRSFGSTCKQWQYRRQCDKDVLTAGYQLNKCKSDLLCSSANRKTIALNFLGVMDFADLIKFVQRFWNQVVGTVTKTEAFHMIELRKVIGTGLAFLLLAAHL